MNCQEFWNTMPEFGDAEGLANHEHLTHCAGCQARLRNWQALKTGLRAVAGEMRRIETPRRVEARLRAAFREHPGMAPSGLRAWPARARWIPAMAWGTAVVVFGLALFLVRGRQPAVATPRAAQGLALAAAGIPAGMETDDGTPVMESGFIPLPNAAQIGENEEVNLVRVEVPRSAMIALGFDVKPEEASQPVQADVMLGYDGLARAVRFLD